MTIKINTEPARDDTDCAGCGAPIYTGETAYYWVEWFKLADGVTDCDDEAAESSCSPVCARRDHARYIREMMAA